MKNFDAKNKALYDTCFVFFLHRPREISIFRDTLQTHMDYENIHAIFFVEIFWHLEIYFFGIESICTWEPNCISADFHSFTAKASNSTKPGYCLVTST
jgi:hypothetical protein